MIKPVESKPHSVSRVLPIISIVTFVGFLDTHLLIPVLALYAAELGVGVGVTGLIIGLYSLTNTPANVLFGRLIDRIGYKVPLIIGLVGDALSMFLYSVSRLPVHLALVRVLHGTMGAFIGPATMSAMAEYSGGRRGRMMGFYGMAIAVATLVGYGLSGALASRLGFRAVFLFGAGMLAVGVVLSLLLPGTNRNREVNSQTFAWRKIRELMGRRGLAVAYATIFAQYFSFGGVVTLLPLYVKGLGMGPFYVGILLAAFAITFIIFQFPSGALSDRVGRQVPIASGLGLGTLSLVLLPSVTTLGLLVAAMAVYGLAYGLLFPSVSALVAEHSRTDERGLSTGVFHALLTTGVAVGAPVMGWVGEMLGVRLGMALTAVVTAGALMLALSSRKALSVPSL